MGMFGEEIWPTTILQSPQSWSGRGNRKDGAELAIAVSLRNGGGGFRWPGRLWLWLLLWFGGAVIQLFMHGGPSHLDLLDPKPMLDRYDGQAPPAEVADDERLTGNLLKSAFRYSKHGQSGVEFSEVLPHTARHADKIAVIRSM